MDTEDCRKDRLLFLLETDCSLSEDYLKTFLESVLVLHKRLWNLLLEVNVEYYKEKPLHVVVSDVEEEEVPEGRQILQNPPDRDGLEVRELQDYP